MVILACNLSSEIMETAGSEVQSHPHSHRVFEGNLGYTGPCRKERGNLFGDKILLYHPAWPPTQDLAVSASLV